MPATPRAPIDDGAALIGVWGGCAFGARAASDLRARDVLRRERADSSKLGSKVGFVMSALARVAVPTAARLVTLA